MSFDFNSIPDSVLTETTMGLVTDMPAMADRFCTTFSRATTMSGTLPRLTNVTTLVGNRTQGLAPGEQAPTSPGGMASTTFECLAYVGKYVITAEEKAGIKSYGLDILQIHAESARAVANLKLDLDMATVLASTSLNEEYDCNVDGSGEWDDPANGRPFEDMLAAIDTKSPGSDTAILGRKVVRTLINHPDAIAESSNFNAGQLDESALVALIKRKLPSIRNVYIMDKFYNSAGEGATEVLAYVGDEVCWIGHKSDLILVHPKMDDQDKLVPWRDHDIRSDILQYERYDDIVRPTKAKGCTFSNIFTP